MASMTRQAERQTLFSERCAMRELTEKKLDLNRFARFHWRLDSKEASKDKEWDCAIVANVGGRAAVCEPASSSGLVDPLNSDASKASGKKRKSASEEAALRSVTKSSFKNKSPFEMLSTATVHCLCFLLGTLCCAPTVRKLHGHITPLH